MTEQFPTQASPETLEPPETPETPQLDQLLKTNPLIKITKKQTYHTEFYVDLHDFLTEYSSAEGAQQERLLAYLTSVFDECQELTSKSGTIVFVPAVELLPVNVAKTIAERIDEMGFESGFAHSFRRLLQHNRMDLVQLIFSRDLCGAYRHYNHTQLFGDEIKGMTTKLFDAAADWLAAHVKFEPFYMGESFNLVRLAIEKNNCHAMDWILRHWPQFDLGFEAKAIQDQKPMPVTVQEKGEEAQKVPPVPEATPTPELDELVATYPYIHLTKGPMSATGRHLILKLQDFLVEYAKEPVRALAALELVFIEYERTKNQIKMEPLLLIIKPEVELLPKEVVEIAIEHVDATEYHFAFAKSFKRLLEHNRMDLIHVIFSMKMRGLFYHAYNHSQLFSVSGISDDAFQSVNELLLEQAIPLTKRKKVELVEIAIANKTGAALRWIAKNWPEADIAGTIPQLLST